MEPQSQVLTVQVEFEGRTYSASYYVEHDIIQTEIGGCLVSRGLTDEPAEDTVRTLLLNYLENTRPPPKSWVPWEGL